MLFILVKQPICKCGHAVMYHSVTGFYGRCAHKLYANELGGYIYSVMKRGCSCDKYKKQGSN